MHFTSPVPSATMQLVNLRANKNKREVIQASAAVIPVTLDWMIRATAMMTPAISRAPATFPLLSSSNSFTPVVS